MADRKTRFARFLQRWWDRQLASAPSPEEWQRGRDEGAIAGELRRTAEFEIVQAAFLHRRPTKLEADAVVDQLVPAPSATDAELLSAAIVRAGATARRVRFSTIAGAAVTVGALALRNVLRGR